MPTSPRARVLIYVVITFALSSIFYVLCARRGMTRSYIMGLMWCPGISGILTTLLTKRSFREFGWRLGKLKFLLWAWLIPMAYAVPAYLIIWITGLGGFPSQPIVAQARSFLHLPSAPAWFVLIVAYFAVAIIAMLIGVISATGEEIGWRGFLVPELMKFNSFTRTAIISGIIWSAWHVPLIVWSNYNSGTPWWYGTTCFVIMVISISFIFAWMRLKSGSLWTAVILHATHNAVIQAYFDGVTVDRAYTKYFAGEFGVALLPFVILFAWLAWKRRAEVQPQPA